MAVVDHDAAEQSPQLKSYYDDNRLLVRNVFFLMIGGSAAGLGLTTATQNLMPLHMQAIGMNAEQNALAMSLNNWLGMPLVIYLSYLTDHWQARWGRRLPFLALSLPFLVIGVFFFPFMQSFVSCLALYGVVAFFSQMKYDTYPLLTYDVVKNRYWGRVNGINTLTAGIFVWLGNVWLMPGVNRWGEKTAYAVCAGLVLALTLPAMRFIKEPPIRTPEPPRFNPVPVVWHVLKLGFARPRNILMFLAYSFACTQWIVGRSFVTLQGSVNLGLSTGDIGTEILQYGTILGVVLAFFMGWAVDRLGSSLCVAAGYVLAVVAAYYGFRPGDAGELRIAYVLSTASISIMYIAAVLFVVASIRREDLASFTACSGAVNLLMQACLTYGTGWMITNWFHENYGLAFVVPAVFGLPSVLLFFLLDAQRKRDLAAAALQRVATPIADSAQGH